MDFSIFSKPLSVPGLGKSRVAKARERAAARKPAPTLELVKKPGETVSFPKTRHGTAAERAKAAVIAGGVAEIVPAFELTDSENGLSAALENAALLHASGQSDVARNLLGGALSNDIDTRELPRAWHAQFDLLQRADDRAGFEQLALEYVTQFESSPPPWDDRRKAVPKAQRTMAGYFAITQINVKTALEIPARAGRFASLKIDVSTVSMFEELGCRRMVDVLRRLRRQEYPVTFQGLEQLGKQIAAKAKAGVAENEGVWLLDLEILQWGGDMHAFDERAFEFAVTFEISPPAWEPSAKPSIPATAPGVADGASAGPASDGQPADAMPEAFAMRGALTGPMDPQVAALAAFAVDRAWIPIDMSQVDRVDFVCAGSLQNMLSGMIAAGKEVQMIAASPVVEALLLLIGLDPAVLVNRARS
jgi:ABC-type transporter Mla MlaB component